ncbi:MAG: bifunctional adenosylcobinamide kinase/adenosylcobinamide-phosphate guanylyltransferase [Chlorobiaceae bacterium]|nr:bifunctional adenosylcobinamide kinase/adenosylcobinamide-phosphate guanylyltransferase [Chlorobiaceae bacterium]
MAKIIYVTGGARSGKSSFALKIAESYENRVFLATAEPFDDEMARRIARHREERKGMFLTLEEPVHPDRILLELPAGTGVVLLDCLTVWAGNLMHHFESEDKIDRCIGAFVDSLSSLQCDIVLVSNEVGMGIVPENAMARKFRDIAGIINQKVASIADEAYFLCSGIPLKLK